MKKAILLMAFIVGCSQFNFNEDCFKSDDYVFVDQGSPLFTLDSSVLSVSYLAENVDSITYSNAKVIECIDYDTLKLVKISFDSLTLYSLNYALSYNQDDLKSQKIDYSNFINSSRKYLKRKSSYKLPKEYKPSISNYTPSKTYQTGKRGGQYYINDNGKKVYKKKK